LSARVEQPQLAGGSLDSKLVEMPMGHATVHKLRKANNIGSCPETSLEKIFQVDSTDRQNPTRRLQQLRRVNDFLKISRGTAKE
jgi:hypothetical protein